MCYLLNAFHFSGCNSANKLILAFLDVQDIRKSIQGNLRPIMAKIPASSIISVRSSSTKSTTMSVSDSPLATRSNASSEPSVNNNSFCVDDIEMECSKDCGSERGDSSPAGHHGR